MPLKFFALWSTAASALIAGVVGQPLDVRRANTPSDFRLFAYGPKESGIGGFPVFHMEGLAYTALNSSDSTSSSAEEVSFTLETSGSLVATIGGNSTATNGTTFLHVPSTSGNVGFTTAAGNSSAGTDAFGLYGGMLYLRAQEGGMETQWYAVAADTAGDGQLWNIKWNVSEIEAAGDGVFPVAIRTTGPDGELAE
ncbi:uncharacterized protein B0I36DRAFT_388356 [Microdochium trichocladiopsis]|uniref:Uncharacterized protein n=1 Tax=Microdochium trichocladiopsis TaxID=1682393 RepID=A0A9P8XVG6_9PEZI|nr:uncharacterized protein B0I36DRAFT_388356 [Microdochium trichocladiopsis]KAH7018081.1 hypothetical protein B0I36DRAFT_388356 [Microdochium trichocladiopsis]